MSKPIIGISASIIVDEGGMFPGYRRTYVNEDYVQSVLRNGGIPLVIPMTDDETVIREQIEQVDALLLTGGHDLSPRFYNEEPLQKLGDIYPERDNFDFTLLDYALKRKLPILGICRGMQIITVFNGGNLYQDLSYREGTTLKHFQDHHPEQITHLIEINPNSQLFELFAQEEIRVNSFHHQIVKELPEGFIVAARAKDGVIEAVEKENYSFCLGVQWHPEMLHISVPLMNALFKELIEQAKEIKT